MCGAPCTTVLPASRSARCSCTLPSTPACPPPTPPSQSPRRCSPALVMTRASRQRIQRPAVSTDRAAATANHSADFVQSLERGLAVIKAFDAEDRELTLSDVARKTGLTRAAARRFLHTLVTLGYVRSDKRMFSMRPRVLELGYAYLSGLSLPEVAQPHLEELTAAVHESTSISVLDGDMVVYVARVAAKRIMAVGITVGTRFPAYATSMGRVL